MLDEELLEHYCEQIDTHKFATDDNLLNQISTLKNLVNRKIFTLSDKQTQLLHRKFHNFCLFRKDLLYKERKQKKVQALAAQHKPTFKPTLVAAAAAAGLRKSPRYGKGLGRPKEAAAGEGAGDDKENWGGESNVEEEGGLGGEGK